MSATRVSLRHTIMFTYSHANTPLGQSERAYYLSYFIKLNGARGAAYYLFYNITLSVFCVYLDVWSIVDVITTLLSKDSYELKTK